MRILMLLLACLSSAAYAEEFFAKVITVLDGDTVLIKRANNLVKLRLVEIDAPEKDQEYGMASKQSLSDLVLKKMVRVDSQAADSYGRLLAHLTVDGHSINEEQVRRGMAWEYSNYHSNKAYVALQNEAQQARRGLWTKASPVPPWQWRKTHATAPPAQGSANQDHSCGSKRRCAEMTSCDEARFYFTHCGMKSLDGDGDGTPCERLCAAKK